MKKSKVNYEAAAVAVEIEETVIATMLLFPNSVMDAVRIFRDEDVFSNLKYKLIYKAISDLYAENQNIDLITVMHQLVKDGAIEKIGGHGALASIANKVSSDAHFETHCYILMQFWIKRKLIDKSMKIISLAKDDETDSLEILEKDSREIDVINDFLSGKKKVLSYAESLTAVVDRVELISNSDSNTLTGVPTGYTLVDRFTGGWQNSDLIIVAGRPGMGKTAFVLKTLVENGKQNRPVGFFSLEMGVEQLAARTIAINSNFHLSQLIKNGFSKPEYFQKLNEVRSEMESFPVYIDDTPSIDIRDLITTARIWKRKYGIQILIVDYLQLVSDRTNRNNREQEISKISRSLKGLAKELNIPVIALSQLSRSVESRNDRRPRLSDLRESGAIEQDADIVMFLYRAEYYGLEVDEDISREGGNAELSFAKYRHGSLETIPLLFVGDKVKYKDVTEINMPINGEPNF